MMFEASVCLSELVFQCLDEVSSPQVHTAVSSQEAQLERVTLISILLKGWFRILDIGPHFQVSLSVHQQRQFLKMFTHSFQLHSSPVLG